MSMSSTTKRVKSDWQSTLWSINDGMISCSRTLENMPLWWKQCPHVLWNGSANYDICTSHLICTNASELLESHRCAAASAWAFASASLNSASTSATRFLFTKLDNHVEDIVCSIVVVLLKCALHPILVSKRCWLCVISPLKLCLLHTNLGNWSCKYLHARLAISVIQTSLVFCTIFKTHITCRGSIVQAEIQHILTTLGAFKGHVSPKVSECASTGLYCKSADTRVFIQTTTLGWFQDYCRVTVSRPCVKMQDKISRPNFAS